MPIEIFSLDTATSYLRLKELFVAKKEEEYPFQRVLNIVQQHNSKTALIERDYEDKEYKLEYDLFYKDVFKPYSDKAIRIHFFNATIREEDLSNIKNFNKNYIGLCILRPLPVQKTFFSIIKPIEDINKPKKSFLLCKNSHTIKINNQKLKIKGFPFIQQDSQLGSCAHAALLMISKYLSTKFGTKEISMRDVIEWAARVPIGERHTPTSGLRPIQIAEVIKQMGYSPIVYEFGKDPQGNIRKYRFTADRVIYHYNESGLPIILGIPTVNAAHALVVVGHSFEPDFWFPLAESPYYQQLHSGGLYHCSTTWVENFIVQDDNFGPYLYINKNIFLSLSQESLTIIVPLPPKVNVKGEDAEWYVYELITEAATIRYLTNNVRPHVHSNTQKWIDLFLKTFEKKEIVLRTYLTKSKDYKKKIAESSLDSHVRRTYLSMNMPEYIWVSEISAPSIFCSQRKMFGEVIIDSTAGSQFGTHFLSIHIPGLLYTRNVITEEIIPYSINNDEPYTHLMR